MAETIKRQFGRLPVFRGPWTSDIESSDVHKFNRYTYLGSEFISTVEGNALSPGEIVNGKLVEHEGWKVTANGTDPGLEAKANIETLANEAVQDAITNTNAAKDAALEAAEAANAAKDGIDAKIDNKANKDGYYGSMTVGSAENLVGRGTTEAEYVNRRTSAGTADIGSGSAAITRIKGRSVVWNQVFNDTQESVTQSGITFDFSRGQVRLHGTTTANLYRGFCTFIKNHKYYFNFKASAYRDASDYGYWGIYNATSPAPILTSEYHGLWTVITPNDNNAALTPNGGGGFKSGNTVDVTAYVQAIDLTLLGIDDLTTVEEVEAWLAQNIGPLDYYAYNPGEVINNAAEGIKTRGFNLFNYATGKAYLPGKYSDYPYEYEICGTFTSISFTDVNGNTSVPELHEGKFFNVDAPGELTVVGGNNTDTLVHLVWSGWRNEGEPDYVYESYWENTLNLGLTSLTGKLNGQGSSVVVFPHGLAKVGDVQDEIVGNRAIKRVGVVDLGTLTWTKSQDNMFGAIVSAMPAPDSTAQSRNSGFLCPKYTPDTVAAYTYSSSGDKTIKRAPYGAQSAAVWVKDSGYVDSTTTTFKTAMNGTLLYYELVTPEEYILDNPPQFNYRVDDFSTEETVPSYDPSNVIAPLAYDVQYAMNAVDAIRRLPDNYVERTDVKQATGNSEKFVLSQKAVNDNYAKKVGVEENLVVGAAKALAGNQQVSGEFTTTVMSGADGVAKISEVRGKSLVWNQLARLDASVTKDGITFTANSDGTVTIDGTAEQDTYVIIFSQGVAISTHTYLGYTNDYVVGSYGACRHATLSPNNFQFIQTGQFNYGIRVASGVTVNNVKIRYKLIDLTLMFGAGNEPSTVEEFEALFPLPYYAFNAGEIISNKTEQVKVVGFNQWDEKWESGTILAANGTNAADTTKIRSKNYIQAFANTDYYCSAPSSYGALRTFYYDAEKNSVGWQNLNTGRSFTVPNRCKYIRFVVESTTYNHDICINISDPSRNGTYEPYKHAELPLNLSTITGKLNGEGESVVIYPDGMRGAGSAYDYLIVDADGYSRKAVKVMKSVDLGNLTGWNKQTDGGPAQNITYFRTAISGRAVGMSINMRCQKYAMANGGSRYYLTDKIIGQYNTTEDKIAIADSTYDSVTAAAFRSAMSGVELIYELATPLIYVLDEPILCTFNAYHGGTLTQTPQAPDSAPMAMSVIYALDAVSELNGLPQNYVSKESLQAMLTAMQSAGLFSAYTMTFNATTGKYEFTFTANNS